MHCFARCNCRLRINNSHGMISAIARLPVIVCGNRSRGLLQELQPRPSAWLGDIAGNGMKGCSLSVHPGRVRGAASKRGIGDDDELLNKRAVMDGRGAPWPSGSGGTLGLLWGPRALLPSPGAASLPTATAQGSSGSIGQRRRRFGGDGLVFRHS